MIKNILKVSFLAFCVVNSISAKAVSLNDVEKDKEANLKAEIINLFTDGQLANVSVENLKQLDKSDNFLFKYQENGNYYTMMYIADIKSVVIQSTGEVFSLTDKKFVTKDFNSYFTKTFIKQIDLKESITFNGKDVSKSDDVYVFTDPTCGYCQKLHREIEEFQDQNINVHYLPFPRGGLSGFGYEQLVNVYCSSDPKTALTESKTLQTIPKLNEGITPEKIQECRDLVGKYYDLGAKMGVKGTPAIFSSNGTQLGGYIPAQQLRYSLSEDLSGN